MTRQIGSARRSFDLWPRTTPVVMAIANCTPDSFSDGGALPTADAAIDHALTALQSGAGIVDVGGESTRPGAAEVDAATEIARVLPVIEGIRRRAPEALISVDTSKAAVARATLDAGADIINDVTAGADETMFNTVAARGATIILMHMRGSPRSMQNDTTYLDVVAEVHEHLSERARAAAAAGIDDDCIWLDPGIGFGKDDHGNAALLRAVPDLATLGHPVVVGASRKSFIGRITGAPVEQRLAGSLAAIVPSLGVARVVVRVHDAAATAQFVAIAHAVLGGAA